MCLLIWTVFSGERCGPWASCFMYYPIINIFLSFLFLCQQITNVFYSKIKVKATYIPTHLNEVGVHQTKFFNDRANHENPSMNCNSIIPCRGWNSRHEKERVDWLVSERNWVRDRLRSWADREEDSCWESHREIGPPCMYFLISFLGDNF